MKIRLSIKAVVQLPPDVIEEKIKKYLKKNFYRITDQGSGYVIFKDDEYSDRIRLRSDFHNRIGEGKLEFNAADQGTAVKLIYFTPIWFAALFMTLFAVGGAYIGSFIPIVMSFIFIIPVVHKIYIMKQDVFDDILKC